MGKVLHASGSGYFPTCIQEASSPDHCPWTLEKAMETYWRVRTWRFQASGNFSSGDFSYPFSTTIDNITSDRTAEDGLVCGNYFSFYEDNEDFPFNFSIGFSAPEKSDNLFTSGIYGHGRDFKTDPVAPIVYEFKSLPYPPEPEEPNHYAPISILGQNLFAQVYVYETEESQELSNATIALTPTLWWSYGGTYNTSTGARL